MRKRREERLVTGRFGGSIVQLEESKGEERIGVICKMGDILKGFGELKKQVY